ncbi:quercetin 2,3-dioxygenase [Marichromatium purpuratum 984]|uniref:Quercetin 2,3-dioxygenase n=1 Tax=Marichromatium purpuratum 984 TaxID=765910 RepID=W0E382_MARPU|nr:pirin family protein [Marichromatium purpuratum]AHF05187.1 quercetin 2,3-dioxygenase [Marichromatium purpuratum 984]
MDDARPRRVLAACPASDGAGVRLRRILAREGMGALDPLLLLDDFVVTDRRGSPPGFPDHPHRGFETLTLMLDGAMAHADHLGNRDLVETGEVAWMRAGRGVIHAEQPVPRDGRAHGLQLWLNLPARDKLGDPAYRRIPAVRIPRLDPAPGCRIRLIAGDLEIVGTPTRGPLTEAASAPLLLDLALAPGSEIELPTTPGWRHLLYVHQGAIVIADHRIGRHQLAEFDDAGRLRLGAATQGAGALLIAARPLAEPVVHYGPFVMNTQAEIDQAIADYEAGRLTD